MTTAARVIRAPGRLLVDPLDAFDGGSFPYGGTPVGRANLCALQPVGDSYHVDCEGLGRTGDILRGAHRYVFTCFLRGWDDKAVELLLRGGASVGDVTQHGVFGAPGSRATGASTLGRSVALAYVPDDLLHSPGVLMYRAVPNWTSGSEMAWQRRAELGIPLTFECVRDAAGRILQMGRMADLSL